MAADPDLLTELALKHAWRSVSTEGLAAWRRTQDYNVYDQASVDAVYAAIVTHGGMQVRSADVPMIANINNLLIGVGLHSATPVAFALGNTGYARANRIGPSGEAMTGQVFQYMMEPTVAIYVNHVNKDVVRMVTRFVKTAMMSAGPWFIKHGVESVPAIVLETDLEPYIFKEGRERAVQFKRQMLFSFKAMERLTPLVITPETYPTAILVHVEGTTVTSIPNPVARTMTPLDGTSQGAVGWQPPE